MEIIEVPSPPSDADESWPWWWVYEGYSRLRHDEEFALWGHTDYWAPTPILVTFLQDSPWNRTVLRVAVRDGARSAEDVLGVAEVRLPAETSTGMLALTVGQNARRQGIGTALLASADHVFADEGRTSVIVSSIQAPEAERGEGVVTAPTDAGRVDLTQASSQFAKRHGYQLEQVMRLSELDLPTDTSDALGHLREAGAIAGPDFRLHTWNRTVPPEFHERLATLWSRMSTDVPSGDLDLEPEEWDARRLAQTLERSASAQQQVFLAAAEHVPSGALVAFTHVEVPDFEQVEFAFQGNTLVMREFRGKRLGMMVKAANLIEVITRRPRIRRLHTDNAEENRYMLAINEALGFRGVGVVAQWQRRRS